MLSEPKTETEWLNAMVDHATIGLNTGTKEIINTYVKLKSILDERQTAKAKALWQKKT